MIDITDVIVRQLSLINIVLYLLILCLFISMINATFKLYITIKGMCKIKRGHIRRKWKKMQEAEEGGDESGE